MAQQQHRHILCLSNTGLMKSLWTWLKAIYGGCISLPAQFIMVMPQLALHHTQGPVRTLCTYNILLLRICEALMHCNLLRTSLAFQVALSLRSRRATECSNLEYWRYRTVIQIKVMHVFIIIQNYTHTIKSDKRVQVFLSEATLAPMTCVGIF